MRRCCFSCRFPFRMTFRLCMRRPKSKWKSFLIPWKSKSRHPLSTLFPLWPLLPQPRTQCTRVPMVRAQAVPSTIACHKEDLLDLLPDAIRDMTNKDAWTRPFFLPTPTTRRSLAKHPRFGPSTASGLRFSLSPFQSVSFFQGMGEVNRVCPDCLQEAFNEDSGSDNFARFLFISWIISFSE